MAVHLAESDSLIYLYSFIILSQKETWWRGGQEEKQISLPVEGVGLPRILWLPIFAFLLIIHIILLFRLRFFF